MTHLSPTGDIPVSFCIEESAGGTTVGHAVRPSGACQESPWVLDHHLGDLLFGDPAVAQRREQRLVDPQQVWVLVGERGLAGWQRRR